MTVVSAASVDAIAGTKRVTEPKLVVLAVAVDIMIKTARATTGSRALERGDQSHAFAATNDHPVIRSEAGQPTCASSATSATQSRMMAMSIVELSLLGSGDRESAPRVEGWSRMYCSSTRLTVSDDHPTPNICRAACRTIPRRPVSAP